MASLVEKLFTVHDALTEVGQAHAFGGAIALAYCTEEPRGTRDLDVNIFTDQKNAGKALAALPAEVVVGPADIEAAEREGQRRLWWGETPIDVFLNTHEIHDLMAERVIRVPLAGREIPVVDCASLAVFKALLDRTKDWADMEAMAAVAPADVAQAADRVASLLGEGDPLVGRMRSLLV
jgi:hypothetical protein